MKVLKSSIVFILIFSLLYTNNIYSNSDRECINLLGGSGKHVNKIILVLSVSTILSIMFMTYKTVILKEKEEVENDIIEKDYVIEVLLNITTDELKKIQQIIEMMSKNENSKDVGRIIIELISDKTLEEIEEIRKIIKFIISSNENLENIQDEITEILSDREMFKGNLLPSE